MWEPPKYFSRTALVVGFGSGLVYGSLPITNNFDQVTLVIGCVCIAIGGYLATKK